ncbi:MAG: potassium channel family protein [Promethearchaeota archaeon]
MTVKGSNENNFSSNFKKKITSILYYNYSKTKSAYLFALVLIILSGLSGLAAIFETDITLYRQFYIIFFILSFIAGILFIIEYILRLWTSDTNPYYEKVENKHLKYVTSLLGIIDLVCVIAFILYLISFIFQDLVDLTRVLRLFAFLKFIRYSKSFEIIYSVIKRKKEDLLITLMLSLLLLFFGSIFIYIAEHNAQPDVITNLFSAMWFTAVNLFTIGYGEIVPLTPFGKIVSAIISILGITLFLLPASVIGSGFIDELNERNPHLDVCPNCNKKLPKDAFLRDIYKKTRGRRSKFVTQALELEKASVPKFLTKQEKCYNLLEYPFPKTKGQIIIFLFFATLITLNVLAIMVETNLELAQELRQTLITVYILSLIVFTIEYFLRLWSCPASEKEEYEDSLQGRLRFMKSPMAIADLLVIIGLILLLIPVELVPVGRVFFLVLLLFVVFKIGHFIDVFPVAGLIFKDTKREFFGAIFICIIFLIFASTAIYFAERDAQPDKFTSIPAALWFGIATFTTTGFGDIYPVTTQGRFMTVAFSFLGVAFFTLPAGILGSSFFSSMKEYRMHKICPKCGYIISRPKLRRKEFA